jgi:hypothetical protein
MEWQLLVVGVIVAGAACYLGRQAWRSWFGRQSGCGGCGCASTSAAPANGQASIPPVQQLTLRRR